jgi:hypothetical protein
VSLCRPLKPFVLRQHWQQFIAGSRRVWLTREDLVRFLARASAGAAFVVADCEDREAASGARGPGDRGPSTMKEALAALLRERTGGGL